MSRGRVCRDAVAIRTVECRQRETICARADPWADWDCLAYAEFLLSRCFGAGHSDGAVAEAAETQSAVVVLRDGGGGTCAEGGAEKATPSARNLRAANSRRRHFWTAASRVWREDARTGDAPPGPLSASHEYARLGRSSFSSTTSASSPGRPCGGSAAGRAGTGRGTAAQPHQAIRTTQHRGCAGCPVLAAARP